MKIKQILKENMTENVYDSSVTTEINFKSGVHIPVATKVRCFFDQSQSQYFTFDFGGEKPARMSYGSAHRYLKGFKKEPSMAALEKMSNNGIATTPLGSRTEPDGVGQHGEPSWLLVIGVI